MPKHYSVRASFIVLSLCLACLQTVVFAESSSVFVTTLAGGGGNSWNVAGNYGGGYADGNGTSAAFSGPRGVAVDGSGNVYVADWGNSRIRKITTGGTVTTLAGGGGSEWNGAGYSGGNGTSAGFSYPSGGALDWSGNVYVADTRNNRIRKITPGGTVTTLAGSGTAGYADGNGLSASFRYPYGVAVDGSGNVYVADSFNNRIRKITPSGTVTTLAGSGTAGYADGNGTSASFRSPWGVAVDGSGNVYVADTSNDRIRKITPGGTVTTLAGSGIAGYADGNGTSAAFRGPIGVAVDGSGDVYVADTDNDRIRKIFFDTDGDGLSDGAEVYTHGTDPKKADTDGDGLSDRVEINTYGTDPKKADTDGDGLSDAAEVNTNGTDPKKSDTDGDGVSDREEINTYGSNPKSIDTDGDGYSDFFEISNLKSSPLASNDAPAFTPVGDSKNPDEDNAGYDVENAGLGYVGQEYEIGTTEISNLMYARFLNAIAKNDALYGLYNTYMGTDASGGIVRSGSNGNYSYTVKTGFENRPVNFVSVYDAFRYINWLHNGMPANGIQDSSTTENGAYKLLGANPRNVVRNAGAKFFLPDQDEWHKAAFFDPDPGQGRPSDSYWPYADQTTTGPGGNFQSSRVNIGATSGNASHYGTYDQGGNVWEWTETVLTDGKRLISQGRPMAPALTTQETANLGFRVARPISADSNPPLVVPFLVPVGEEFNLGDDTNGNRGAVVYEYQIGTYEITNAEYQAFLNVVAKTDSFYGLYNTQMGSAANGGIMRSGQNGNFIYTVKPGFAKKPVNFVNIYNAMRFCNWLHNGAQPNGDTEAGAYRLLGNIPADTVKLRRNASARYFIPTEDEWYKAAFYDPSPIGMPTASFWSYATKSDSASAAMNFGGSYLGPMDIDALPYPSFFKTYGQSGNVAEWLETVVGITRVVRGGHYSSNAEGVSSLGKLELDPLTTVANIGFRVAAAPGVASPLETVGPSPTPTPVPSPNPGPSPSNSPVAPPSELNGGGGGAAPSGGGSPPAEKAKKGGKSSAKKSNSGSSKKSAASKSSGGKKSGGKKKKK